jgi:hypothetical protein
MERRNAPFAYDLCSDCPDQGKSLVMVVKEDWQSIGSLNQFKRKSERTQLLYISISK